MRVAASDLVNLYSPSKCPLRVYLHEQSTPEDERSPYSDILQKMGKEHEARHLQSFPKVADLSEGTLPLRAERTRQAISRHEPVIYQPVFQAVQSIGNAVDCEIVGIPDFLVLKNGNYIIRDCKAARRINDSDHPEITLQLNLYGWLFEQAFDHPPLGLEVFNGRNEIVPVDTLDPSEIIEAIAEIVELKNATQPPWCPPGVSKCQTCVFKSSCYQPALERNDVALVVDVHEGLARILRTHKVHTAAQLVDAFDEQSLAELTYPSGARKRRVGKGSSSILLNAQAQVTGKVIVVKKPKLPNSKNYVMFDIEGIPPQLEMEDRIFLWGLKRQGKQPTEFRYAFAARQENADQEAWFNFLELCEQLLADEPKIPFVHWHHYETTHIKQYIERYGDPDGIAACVLENLFDALPVAKRCIAVPAPSYSLKVLEKLAGFERTIKEGRGDWAIAMYIEALELDEGEESSELIDQVLKYNEEDLDATWAVFSWLKTLK